MALIIINQNLFSITNQNLLLALDLQDGKILYAYNIDKLIAKFLDKKEKKNEIKQIMLLNNKIFILTDKNLLRFSLNGKLESMSKLKYRAASDLIFINSSILFLDYSKKLIITD